MENRAVWLLMLVCFFHLASGQQNLTCEAHIEGLVTRYDGECKDGLADGRGKTFGRNFYAGQFKKGKPHGEGIFTWENGDFYDGRWKNGRREGSGTLVLRRAGKPDSVVIGVWEAGKLVREKTRKDWLVVSSKGVARYKFQRISENSPDHCSVHVRVTRNGLTLNHIAKMKLSGTGIEYDGDLSDGFKKAQFPFKGKADVSLPGTNGAPSEATFEYLINTPGKWLLTIDM